MGEGVLVRLVMARSPMATSSENAENTENAAKAFDCPEAHGLQSGLTPSPGRLCDICKTTMSPGSDRFACKECDFDVCKQCMNGCSQSKKSKMLDKVFKYVEQAQSYADKARQEKVLRLLPESLYTPRGAPDENTISSVSSVSSHITDLLKWFKSDFFKWTDSPFCEKCSVKATKNEGLTEPFEEELRYGANRVESWRCTGCNTLLRFPRYNDPARLLETRHGRCGEWANCFTLILTALKMEARLVVDWTDHVWTEVWFDGRWHHCDPCEACLDAPQMYESGWGKKLSYIVAFSPHEVVDVSARYTRNWPELLNRRKALGETEFAEIISTQDVLARSKSGLELPTWRKEEENELFSLRAVRNEPVSQTELCGRTSGSHEWRRERGECGPCHPVFQEADFLLITSESTAMSNENSKNNGANLRNDAKKVLQAQLLNGASIRELGYVQCLDLRPMLAAVEVVPSSHMFDPFLSDDGFTVEAWVFARKEDLKAEAFRNPVMSCHGPASGWELRLCQNGGAIFLVTIDGVHLELTAPGSPWLPRWTHIAASFQVGVPGQSECTLRVYICNEALGELCAPSGQRSTFPGPFCLGRNPAWTDRSACICLHSARVTSRVLDPKSFLPPPKPDGASFL